MSSPSCDLRSADRQAVSVNAPMRDGRFAESAVAQVFVEDPASPVLSPADQHHLERVLRVKPGEVVISADGAGRRCECRTDYRTAGSRVVLVPLGEVIEEPRPDPCLSVAFAALKGDRTELVVQKLSELGVDRIVVLNTDRSVVRWDTNRRARAMERVLRIAQEASAQSRRAWLPELLSVDGVENIPRALGFLPSDGGDGGEGGDGGDGGEGGDGGDGVGTYSPQVALGDIHGAPPSTEYNTVVVGPEGGWSPKELELGLPMVRLSPQILRAETAAITAGVVLTSFRAGTLAAVHRSPRST